MQKSYEIANFVESKVEQVLLQGILPASVLSRNGIRFNSSNDQNLNQKVSVNEITEPGNIKESLYAGGYGALSVVAERASDPINGALIQHTSTFQRKFQQIQNRKRDHVNFILLSEDLKNSILNGKCLKDEAIVSTLEDPDKEDAQAQRIVKIIRKRMQDSAVFVCRVSKRMALHLDFEILGRTERRLSQILDGLIQSVLIPEDTTNEFVPQKLMYGVPIHFVPLKERRVTIVLGADTFQNVSLKVPDFETILFRIHQDLEIERILREGLDRLECKYLTHIMRF